MYKLNYHDKKIRQALRTTYGNTGPLFRPNLFLYLKKCISISLPMRL